MSAAYVIAGDPVDEGIPVRAGDLELAHMRHIEDAGGGADGVMLGQDSAGVLHRHLPAGKGNHLPAQCFVGIVQGSALQSLGISHFLPRTAFAGLERPEGAATKG